MLKNHKKNLIKQILLSKHSILQIIWKFEYWLLDQNQLLMLKEKIGVGEKELIEIK